MNFVFSTAISLLLLILGQHCITAAPAPTLPDARVVGTLIADVADDVASIAVAKGAVGGFVGEVALNAVAKVLPEFPEIQLPELPQAENVYKTAVDASSTVITSVSKPLQDTWAYMKGMLWRRYVHICKFTFGHV